MNAPPRSTAERLRRARRDLEAHRRASLARRAQGPRFRRYLGVVPHLYLSAGPVLTAPLLAPVADVLAALRGAAVWTLDTAARLRFGSGILGFGDLHCYVEERAALDALAARGLIGPPREGALGIDPVAPRPPLLFAVAAPAAAGRLPTGDLAVPDARLVEDILGTLGLRADLLARLEAGGLVAPPA